jgi:hypothetical protein
LAEKRAVRRTLRLTSRMAKPSLRVYALYGYRNKWADNLTAMDLEKFECREAAIDACALVNAGEFGWSAVYRCL